MALSSSNKKSGIGMTSTRTRDRMLARLREQGIKDEATLAAIGEVPDIYLLMRLCLSVLMKMCHCLLALGKPFLNPILWQE